MLVPIGDDDRKLSGPAYVTTSLIIANLAVFFLFQFGDPKGAFTYGWSVIPLEITTGVDLVEPQEVVVNGEAHLIPQAPGPRPIYLTIFSAMFMHAGLMHLFGNLLYLWIFGDNVEHRFGHRAFLLFYLMSGLVATVAQIALEPGGVVPNLGASGAISGVLGAYMVLFPRNRVYALFFFFWIISIPAIVAIGLWIAFQFVDAWGAVVVAQETLGGVAYGAHIGGFFTGVVMGFVGRVFFKQERKNVFSHHAAERSRQYW